MNQRNCANPPTWIFDLTKEDSTRFNGFFPGEPGLTGVY